MMADRTKTLFMVTNTKLVIKALNSMRSNSHWLVRKVHQLEIDVPALGGWRPPGMWVTMREVGGREREGGRRGMHARPLQPPPLTIPIG